MTQQNVNAAAVAEQNAAEEADKAPKTIFATEEAAKAAWTPTGKARLLKITKEVEGKEDEVIGFVWGHGYDNALAKYARSLGFVSSNAGASGTVTKAAILKAAVDFTEEEWAQLMKARQAGASPAKATEAATTAANKPAANPKKK